MFLNYSGACFITQTPQFIPLIWFSGTKYVNTIPNIIKRNLLLLLF
jgi:hypothetical protein